jgi:SRSO17 transposase
VKRAIRLLDEIERYHSQFWGVYKRQDTRDQGLKYLRGLMGSAERKNGWQLAEMMGDDTPDKMQWFLSGAAWDETKARDQLQKFVIDELSEDDGIGIFDETGFLKKGEKSAGVSRQYSGTAGKVENCQIGTFFAYSSTAGSVLIDRRLYLPEVWTSNRERCRAAKIPDAVTFQTKPEQAQEMFEEALARGMPLGNAPALRNAIDKADKKYVLAVASTTPVWLQNPGKLLPKRVLGNQHSVSVGEAIKQVSRWERLCVEMGEKGPIIYDWTLVPIREQTNKKPGRAGWLLARRSVEQPEEIAYYLSNAGQTARISTLAKVASARFNIELCFKQAKGETGLDHYEVRCYKSWYRHITMSMMALAFLVVLCGRATQAEDKKTSRSRRSA